MKWVLIPFFLTVIILVGVHNGPKKISEYRFENADKTTGRFIDSAHPDEGSFNPPESSEILTMFAIGDTGTGDDVQFQVASAMNSAAEKARPACIMMLGDNFYPDGVSSFDDPLWETHFEVPYNHNHLQIPFYACLGNHDHDGNIAAQVARTWIDDRWRMPARNYLFYPDSENKELIGVVVIDTEPIAKRHLAFKSGTEELDAMLSQLDSKWKIVFGHHPIRSGGRADYFQDRVGDQIQDILKKHQVDLYLSGHNHMMEMGAVDQGLTYAIFGSGGQVEAQGYVKIPNMFFASDEAGFGQVRVLDDRIVIDFINGLGERIYTKSITK